MSTIAKPLAVFAPEGEDPDPKALAQIEMVLADERAVAGVLCADHHLGYSMPIGGVVAYEGGISPTGVGYDIACGNKAALTGLTIDDLPQHSMRRIMDEIQRKIAFGMGRSNAEAVDHSLFDTYRGTLQELDKLGRRNVLSQKARAQLGTVGAGNHYVDVLVDELGRVWVACHFGSRGLGHTIASGFLNLARNQPWDHRGKEAEEAIVFDVDSELGQFYIGAMHLAGAYAYAGRDYVIGQVLQILGTQASQEVHCHHNYAWLEGDVWVVRKGATPLYEDELAFIGGSMADGAVIVRRREGHFASVAGGLEADLGSAPHGAGRAMSRTKAAGKQKRRKLYGCPVRDCEFSITPQAYDEQIRAAKKRPELAGHPDQHVVCPEHARPLRKFTRFEKVSEGLIDWERVQRDLVSQGVVLRGAGADEAPGVYKNLDAVIAAHPNVEVVHRLEPLGVVMAGPEVEDLYRD